MVWHCMRPTAIDQAETASVLQTLQGFARRGQWIGRTLAAFALLLFFSGTAHAQTVKLAWNANTETDLAGYRVYYGTAPGVYTDNINVGNVTTYTVTGLNVGQPY